MKKRLGRFQKGSDQEPIINLTPLIDVVFVILIVFMLVAPLLETENIDLAPGPENSVKTANIKEKSSITIYVKKDNTIWYNKQSVTIDQLVFFLRQARSQKSQITPQLFHDKEAHFGTYQSVKNAVEVAGFDEMDVVLQPS